ncbi:phosphatidylserine decarboxylase [Caulobacter sp. FWC2]
MHAFLGPNDYHRQHAPAGGAVLSRASSWAKSNWRSWPSRWPATRTASTR